MITARLSNGGRCRTVKESFLPRQGKHEVVKVFVEHEDFVRIAEKQDNDGRTALRLAAGYGG